MIESAQAARGARAVGAAVRAFPGTGILGGAPPVRSYEVTRDDELINVLDGQSFSPLG
ncbi:hypothetical protein [Micromonospora sp. S4605]|uniref:hypothetical protein n=1 Tax=Micromonospora sp. S4605 TaxID=1420897 RepID=UPI00130546E8|nr:hypothetical protein [Micromonospora sp. S4605]